MTVGTEGLTDPEDLVDDYEEIEPYDEVEPYEEMEPYEDPDIGVNYGQAATVVHGGMHQTVYHETKLLKRIISAQQLTPDHVASIMETFVERVYDWRSAGRRMDRFAAADLLAHEPYVVLLGPRGSGLGTAAVALMDGFGRNGRRLERIAFDEEDDHPFTGVDLPAERNVVYLLRLPRQVERISPDFGDNLREHAARLKDLDARLVVTATAEVWRASGGHVDAAVLDVSMPDPAALLLRRCADAGVAADAIAVHPAVSELLQGALAEDAERLAWITVDAVRRHPDAEPDALAREISGAYGNWDEHLADWFRKHPDLRARLFLVSAAMLEGAEAAEILGTVNVLGTAIGDLDGPAGDGLAEAGLRALIAEIGAEAVDGRLRFTRANYADAVLTFVHADRSSTFRKGLWKWATSLPTAHRNRRSSLIAARVVNALVAMVLQSRDPRLLNHLGRWVDRPHLRGYVVEALTATALSDEVGVEVRYLLYRWATSAGNSHLLTTVAMVCGGKLADSYPRVSLTRLGHLAARQRPAVTEAVVEAVLRLWERPSLRQRVLRSLVEWTTQTADARAAVAWRVLALLTGSEAPPIVVDDRASATRQALVRATARLFDQQAANARTEFGRATLDAALASEAHRDAVTSFFADVVRSGPGGASRVARIRAVARQWQPSAGDAEFPVRRELRDRLLKELENADPLTIGS